MLISKAEMEVLRVIGVFKDCSAEIVLLANELVSENINLTPDIFYSLLNYKFIRYNKTRTSLRLTETGVGILSQAGFHIHMDVHPISEGKVLERRFQNAEIAFFLRSLEIDVCLTAHPKEPTSYGFLSAGVMRSLGARNVYGMSKFNGILYSPAETYPVYNISDSETTFYPQTDEDMFRREIIRANNPVKILYMYKNNLEDLINSLKTNINKRVNACGYYKAISEFTSPVCLIPLNKNGLQQLQIMLVENYKEKISRYLLAKRYQSVSTDNIDAIFSDTKECFIVFIDFDVKRLEKVCVISKKPHILILNEQKAALEMLLNGRPAVIYTIEASKVFEVLDIKPVKSKLNELFLTKEGEGIFVKEDKKINKKNKSKG